MIKTETIVKKIEDRLNDALSTDEKTNFPFRLYTDIGDALKAYRVPGTNTVRSARYGIATVIASDSVPLNAGALQIYSFSLAIDILVNVDRMQFDGSVGDYPEVKKVREIIDELAATESGVPDSLVSNGINYTFIPVYTLGGAGAYSVQASELGKVVPITFTVSANIVQNGVNSADITIEIDDEVIPCSQFGFDMVSSTEGQTRSNGGNSKFNVQETTFTISFITPLVNSAFCKKMIQAMHRGGSTTPLSVSITYESASFGTIPTHTMYAASVRLTGAIPDNVGLNVELIEADTASTT